MGRTRLLLAVAVVAGLAAVALVGARVSRADDGPGDVDVGFLQDMIDHHEQATLLSTIALRGDVVPSVRNVAVDVIATQRYEIGLMDGWLLEWGRERGSPSRTAMTWMGMHSTPADMPGMASARQLDALGTMSGHDLDRELLELMIDHHQGGIHMAETAHRTARNAHVRWLAGQIVRNQRREIRELTTLLTQLAR